MSLLKWSWRALILALLLAVTSVLALGCNTSAGDETQPRQLTGQTDRRVLDTDPTWLPGGRILFSRGGVGLLSMNLDGGDTQQIPGTTGEENCASVSPGGSQIAFSRLLFDSENMSQGSFIFVMNSDGSELVQLKDSGPGAGCPRWSPNGTRIAFSLIHDRTKQLYTMNADGSQVVELTPSAYDAYSAAWEPSGERIAFVDQASHEIYLISSQGGEPVQVTSDGRPKGSDLAWSPDGRWIVYPGGSGNSEQPRGLYAIHPDGTDGRLVLKSMLPDNAAFSRRGDLIAFSSGWLETGSPRGNIYVMRVGNLLQ